MIRLDTATRKLQAILAGAVSANQLPITVCYSDKTATAYTGGTQVSTTNSETAVDICAAPAASTIRDVDTITAQNADTAEATLTIRYNDNGTLYTLFKAVLSVGDQVTYAHGAGWKVCDSSGAMKSLSSDIVTLTGTQTLTNKTLTSPVINGTITTTGLTIPAITLGGAVAGNSQNITGLTTVDSINLEITNLKANDGTAAGSIANSTGVVTLASTVLTTTDINGGTIDGATIGGSSPGAGTFTTLTSTGNATLGDAEAIDTHAIKGATTVLANSASAALMVTQTGAGNALLIEDSASSDSTPFAVDANGKLIIGATASVDANATFQIVSTSAYLPQSVYLNKTNDANAGYFKFAKDRAGAIVSQNDALGFLLWTGYDGAAQISAAGIYSHCDGTPGTNDMPGRLVFSTTADGASTPTERLRIDSSGNILNRSTGGLGYGTGSGGAVTQLTSRTTGVTLNKTNGAITLVSAAGSTSWQTFTVTNSTVAATDTIIVNQKSGTDLNMIHVTAVAAGSFNISFATTGGTTTEQPVFNFAVIKAVTS